MKALLILISSLIVFNCYPQTKKSLKEDLKECKDLNTTLTKALEGDTCVTIIGLEKTNRKDVRINKQEEKTKRILSSHEVKVEELKKEMEALKAKYETALAKKKRRHNVKEVKSDHKKEVKTDKFRNLMKAFKMWQLWLGIGIGVVVSNSDRLKAVIKFARNFLPI